MQNQPFKVLYLATKSTLGWFEFCTKSKWSHQHFPCHLGQFHSYNLATAKLIIKSIAPSIRLFISINSHAYLNKVRSSTHEISLQKPINVFLNIITINHIILVLSNLNGKSISYSTDLNQTTDMFVFQTQTRRPANGRGQSIRFASMHPCCERNGSMENNRRSFEIWMNQFHIKMNIFICQHIKYRVHRIDALIKVSWNCFRFLSMTNLECTNLKCKNNWFWLVVFFWIDVIERTMTNVPSINANQIQTNNLGPFSALLSLNRIESNRN